MGIKLNWDMLGIGTSVACAIHCAVLPLVATSLPILGINIIHNTIFEWGMIMLAFVVGTYALFHGYIKHHRTLLPIFIFLSGFAFLVLKQYVVPLESMLLLFAVVLIILAHYFNYRLCRQSKCVSPHHKH